MDTLPEDQKVINLLEKLKHSPNGYPSEMLEARRQMYLKQLANVGLGLGAGVVVKNAAKGNGTGTAATVTSKVLEMALIAAILIEAGTVTYLYRDKIFAFLGLTDPIPVVATQPEFNTALPETIGDLQTPLVEASETPTLLPSETPAPVQAGDNNPASSNNDNNTTNINANATPDPSGSPGNQYGLTPKPDRTKENQSDGNHNNGGNNDNNKGNNKDK